jgi:hypothetical protein
MSRYEPRTWKTPASKTRTADRIANAPRPISSAVIDAVLRYADVEEDLGGGRALFRLSPARAADNEVRRALGDAAARAGSVSILWNTREDQIIQVLDGAANRMAA